LENIDRHINLHDNVQEAAEKGASEIVIAVTASTLTNIVVFLPIAFMSGIVGQFFKSFGLTVVFATLLSLYISFTLVPMLSGIFLTKRKKEKFILFRLWDKGYDLLGEIYKKCLAFSLRFKWSFIALSVVILFFSLKLAKHIGSEFITEADKGELMVFTELAPGKSIEETEKIIEKFNNKILTIPEVRNLFTQVGKLEGVAGKSTSAVNVGQTLILLSSKETRNKNLHQLMEEVRQKIAGEPGIKASVSIVSTVGGAEAPFQLELYGPELDELAKLKDKAVDFLKNTQGSADIDNTWVEGKPEVIFIPDRKKIADAGLSIAEIALSLRYKITGFVPTKFKVSDKEYDIRIKLSEENRESTSQIKNYLVTLANGKSVSLSSLGKIISQTGPTQIIRKNKQRIIVITSNTKDRSLGEIVDDMKKKLNESNIPAGYSYGFSGMAERMGETFIELLTAMLLATVLTYIVLAALLESYIQPLTIMITLPLALIGVFTSLYITHQTISLFSLMGIVMLIGMVVNNAILLLDYIGELRSKGYSRTDAILEGCSTKLKAIIMTTAATIIGMLPLALGQGLGAEQRMSMAIVSIGGMITSTILALFIVPGIYVIFDNISKWFSKKK